MFCEVVLKHAKLAASAVRISEGLSVCILLRYDPTSIVLHYYYALGVVPERVILLLLCYNATPPTPAYSRRLHSCSGPTPRFTRSS